MISSIYILDQILHGIQVVYLVSSLAYGRFYFYILTLDPVTTMNLLNYGLSVDPLRLLAYKITLSVNKGSFNSSFTIWRTFFPFLTWLHLLEPLVQCQMSVARANILILFLGSSRESILYFILSVMLAVGFSYMSFVSL